MSIIQKNRTDCFNSMKSYLQTLTTNLSDFNTGSVLLSMFDTVAAEMEQLYSAQEQIQGVSFIATATGTDLDNKVADYSLTRRGATYSAGVLTFGRTTSSSQDYTLAVGTMATTSASSATPGITFETIEEEILPAGSLTVTVNARCKDFGSSGNVTSNSITVLPSPPAGIEFVNNYSAFIGGSDSETDEELRARLSLYLNSLSRGTKLALESAALSVTGIESVSILENQIPPSVDITPGYVTMYIADASGSASAFLISQVEAQVEQYRPCAVIVFVKSPTPQLIDIKCWINVDTAYNTADVINAVTSAINSYLLSLGLNEDVNRAKLIDSIIAVAGVLDVDTTMEEKLIDELELAYPTSVTESGTTSNKNLLITDYAAYTVTGCWLAYDTGRVRDLYAGTAVNRNLSLNEVPIVNEQQTSISATRVDVNYDIADMIVPLSPAVAEDGVWDNIAHTGTNYARGGTFSGKTITLGTPLSSPNMVVYVQYTEMGGTHTQTAVFTDYDKQQVDVANPIADVQGIWLVSDIDHNHLNYYTDGSFDSISQTITVGTTLPTATEPVHINYWKKTTSQGLVPYDNVTISSGRIARPNIIQVSLHS